MQRDNVTSGSAGGKYMKGFFDPLSITLMLGAFCIGWFYMTKSNAIDAPLEQLAESILGTHGIDIDFSADKKDEG